VKANLTRNLALALLLAGGGALAQPTAAPSAPAPPAPALAGAPAGWEACQAMRGDDAGQLACFRRWADAQRAAQAVGAPAAAPAAALASNQPAAPANTGVSATNTIASQVTEGCRDAGYSVLSRFWDLEKGSACDTFEIRGYRPISLMWTSANSVNTQPTSPAAGHSALAPTAYRPAEMKIQLSVRTKIVQGLLTANEPVKRDSLWFGYTSQSYWQLFNGGISRPFRNTDHEPEVVYIYPIDTMWPGGWRQRLGGIGLVHQSNGQSLPLSRSWNRIYLMAAFEKDDRWQLQARVWQRVTEKSSQDDNPDISSRIGRAELSASWALNKTHTLGMTLRHPMSTGGGGSVRLDWMRALGSNPNSGLRLHASLFSGYGDSLIDYNFRRTVFSLGLSLVEF
jgi:phospholipase A1